MATKVITTWASTEDMNSSAELSQSRRLMLNTLRTEGKLSGTPNIMASSSEIFFHARADAETWAAYIQSLAQEYSKNIIGIQLVDL